MKAVVSFALLRVTASLVLKFRLDLFSFLSLSFLFLASRRFVLAIVHVIVATGLPMGSRHISVALIVHAKPTARRFSRDMFSPCKWRNLHSSDGR